jgi:hypothetical protein
MYKCEKCGTSAEQQVMCETCQVPMVEETKETPVETPTETPETPEGSETTESQTQSE